LLLRWNGYSLQDQNGVVYYDSTEPEYVVAGKVYALESWAQKYFKDHGHYPASGDIAYVNPISKRPDKIITINSKDLNDKYLSDLCQNGGVSAHPCMIVCGASGPRKFYIGALDRMKNPIPLLGSHNEFIVLAPSAKSTAAELSEALTRVNGIVVFEEAVDSFSYFVCAHTMLLFTCFVLLLGAVGPVIFLVTKNWRTTLRTSKKRPTVGEPSTR
jgi:hypothetical protein